MSMAKNLAASAPKAALALALAIWAGATPPTAEGAAPRRAAEALSDAELYLPPVQIAAPPAEFLSGALRLPDYSQTGARSRAAIVPARLEPVRNGEAWTWSREIPVDSWNNFTAVFVGSDALVWDLAIQAPGEPAMTRDSFAGRSDVLRVASPDDPLMAYPSDAFSFATATPGRWRFQIDAQSVPARTGDRPDGWLILGGDSPWRLYSHFDSRDFLVGGRVGVRAWMFDQNVHAARAANDECVSSRAEARATLSGMVSAMEATLYLPDDAAQALALFDDGRHGDDAANDGIFGGWIEPTVAGAHRLEISASGRAPDGLEFLRTTTHAFPVIERSLALQGYGVASPEDDLRLRIDLPVHFLTHEPPTHLQMAAEVWGRGAAGEEVPVCWLARMAAPRANFQGGWDLSMWLDARWLDLAGVSGGLELRNVRVLDPDAQVPIARAEALPLRVQALPALAGSAPVSEPAQDMLASAAPMAYRVPTAESAREFSRKLRSPARWGSSNLTPGSHSLLITHGYCSLDVWEDPLLDIEGGAVGDYFDEPKVFFQDFFQNRSHDQFAQLLRALGLELKSFGIVAHSQGGCAAVHLWTYYYSGLDWARGPGTKLIQSVGSPYQGTTLASLGWLACGTATNMTYDGAATWLSGIPASRRAAVWHHTTDYEGEGFGKYCNLATVLLLDKPEDGVTEHLCGQLPGAHNEGLRTPWCHGYDVVMKHPSQTSDQNRNITMSSVAKR